MCIKEKNPIKSKKEQQQKLLVTILGYDHDAVAYIDVSRIQK